MSQYVAIKDGMGEITESGGTYSTTGMTEADLLFTQSHIIGSAGIVGATDLAVTENSPADKSVNVAAGEVYVENSSYSRNSSQAKYWQVTNDATVNVSIADNTSGNPRIDVIYVQVDTVTTPNGDASNIVTIGVEQGTPASSPSAPSTPPNAYKLAEVAVANGFTSIVNANITDSRSVIKLHSAGSEVVNLADEQTITGDKTVPSGGFIQSSPYVCQVRAGATGTSSIPNATLTAINFQDEVGDLSNMHSNTTNPTRITAPVNGYYVISGSISYGADGSGIRLLRYYVNGSLQNHGRSSQAPASGTDATDMTFATMQYLGAGDYVELYAYQNSGGALSIGQSATWLEVGLLNRLS